MIRLLFSLAILFAVPAFGQIELSDFDTIPVLPAPKKISNVIFQFDNRNESYYDLRGRMNGLKLGVEYYKRVRTGFGFYGNGNFYEMRYPSRSDTISESARFSYSTLFAELVLFRNFRWEVATGLALGRGTFRLNQFNISGSTPEFTGSDTIRRAGVIDIALQTHFKAVSWAGLGFGVGYRNVGLDNYQKLADPFSSTYFDFKIKLFLGYLYKSIFKPELIQVERAYYDYRRAKRQAELKKLFK